jgi:hypothetical protein
MRTEELNYYYNYYYVSAHGDCTVAKEFNQCSVACKNFKGLTFKSGCL